MKTPDEIKKGVEYLSIKDITKKLDAWKEGIAYDYAEDAAADALAYIQQLEAQVPMWRSANEPPERWRMEDKEKTLINYLVYMPEYGVDIGNWLKPAKRWMVMGIPAKVTHWMPLPEPPEEDDENNDKL